MERKITKKITRKTSIKCLRDFLKIIMIYDFYKFFLCIELLR